MDRLEQELRDLLTNERHALRTDLVPLEQVHAGAKRRRRRRAAVLTTATAVVLAAVAVPVVLSAGDDQPRLSNAIGTVSSSPSSDAASSPATTSEPEPVGASWDGARVTSVTATSTQTLVVLGALGDTGSCDASDCLRLAESHDGGRTFSPLPMPGRNAGYGTDDRTASQVRFGSAQDGWVFDDGLWSTHDGGHTWTDIFLGRVLHLEAAAGTVWALTAEGSGKAQLWRSPVDDDNWVPVKGVTVDRQADLAVQGSRVIVVDADKTWVGQGEGNEFVAHPSPCDSPALQVRLSASGSLWAKCVTGMAAYVATSADGTSWQTVQPKGLDQMLPNSLTIGARGADDALLASDPAQPLFDLQSDGTQVAVSKPPTTGAHIDYLGFTTDDVGYAVVTEGLWRTDDGGDTWRKLAIG